MWFDNIKILKKIEKWNSKYFKKIHLFELKIIFNQGTNSTTHFILFLSFFQ